MKLTAIVTGANRGIGKEVVRQLAATGKYVTYLVARNETSGKEAVQEINAQYPESTKFIKADVAQNPQQILEDLTYNEGLDTVDILINNAAIMGPGATYDKEAATKTLKTNYYGLVNTTETLLPFLYRSSQAKIINVGAKVAQVSSLKSFPYKEKDFIDVSSLTREDLDKYAEQFLTELPQIKSFPIYDYKFSKMLVLAYTRILAKQLEPSNIAVNAVDPGWCKTSLGGAKAPRSPADGAKVMIHVATNNVGTGKFFEDQREIKF